MASSPLRLCSVPGCNKTTRESRCEGHAREPRTRGTLKEKDQWYSNRRWRKLRAWFLTENPLCQECKRNSRVTPANEVHHVKPRKEYPELSYDETNLEALCKRCHSKATAREKTVSK